MRIYLATGNSHKLQEARAALGEFGIEVEGLAEEKLEPKELGLEEVAVLNARRFHEKHKVPVAVDDTGVFFSAFPRFPGSHPKLMFELLGYSGLLKLLEGEDRRATFRSVIAYCDEQGVRTFVGELPCLVDSQVHDPERDVLPYERIMLYKGRPISSMSRQEKNAVSHRAQAFRQLGQFLSARA